MGYDDRTAAIRYHNGSVKSLAKVERSSEYKALMRRVAKGDGGTTASFDNSPSIFTSPRRESHQKTLELTGSVMDEVRIIGDVLAALKAKSEAHLRRKLSSVLAIFPNIHGLHD